jgi:uncharacterized protein
MKWTPGGESQDVEDRRDDTGGGGGGFGFGGMHIGIGGAIILLILSFVFKTNFFALLGGGGGSVEPAPARVSDPNTPRGTSPRDQAEKPLVQFVSFVLDDTTPSWCCFATRSSPGVAARNPRRVLFIARRTKKSISTSVFTMS